jgi:phosphatidylinositol alpha 1,6-mannosyltransferase
VSGHGLSEHVPRVAFFTDTFTEINGVALTSRQLTGFAQRRGYPFLCIRGAGHTRQTQNDSTIHLELARGPLAFDLDKDLRHDPFLWRHHPRVSEAIEAFNPEIIHVVSPGDVSEIGVYIAKRTKIPLAISWHTNLHEFGALRLARMLDWMGDAARRNIATFSESTILSATIAFYKLGDVLYAPNDELVEMLRQRTEKPVFLMKRGIDTQLFSPARRTAGDGVLRLGYVGRVTPEKNVRFLRDLEIALRASGAPPVRFLIVGDGSDREWLSQNLAAADLPGILRGEALAEAYANMDVFVFPSRTDTFGNVVLEAFASGRPAVVTDAGGPKFIVRDGISGFVAHNDAEFIERTMRLICDAAMRERMGSEARRQALAESWDSVFEQVYDGYGVALQRFTARAP